MIFTLVIMGATVAVTTGFYPVAFAGMRPIFYRTLMSLQQGMTHYLVMQAKSAGEEFDPSVSEHADFLSTIKKDSLTLLIEDAIIVSEGRKLIEDFDAAAKSKGEEASKNAKNLAKSIEFAYALTRKEFNKLILMPQARRDVVRRHLEEKNQTFDEWLKDAKKLKRIRILFVPYEWDGEGVR